MSSLTCNEFDGLLIEQTAARNHADERLSAHAAACPRCAAVWSDERALDSAINLWKTAVPEADVVGRVLAGWRQERTAVLAPRTHNQPRPDRSTTSSNRHYSLLAVVVAAGLILAVSLFSQNPGQLPRDFVNKSSRNGKPSVAANTQPAAALPDQAIELDQLVAGMRTRYSGATQRMTRIVGGWKVPWPAMADVDLTLLPQQPAAARKPISAKPATSGLGETLKPIGRDVRKAFSFLRDAVPGLDGSKT